MSTWTFGDITSPTGISDREFTPVDASQTKKRRYSEFQRIRVEKPAGHGRIQALLDRIDVHGVVVRLDGTFLVFRASRGVKKFEESKRLVNVCREQYEELVKGAVVQSTRAKLGSSHPATNRRAGRSRLVTG